ncbi:unnamed protein product [Dovyalis caffra]|uniref:Uncharacterized protein n=1 Tax=Dovyalis caffra TaxID=77055 RepID=A0AAV1QVU7_9ROSI|nr:unnamed protein product [Dovyalis caffra]
MPVLLKSSEAAVQKRCIASSSETLFNKLCYNIVPALVKSLTKGTGVEILESLDECMKVSGAILEEEDIKFFLVQKMEVLIKSPSISRSKMVDTTDQEPVEEENLKEEKISDKAADCLSTLIGTQKYCLSSLVDKLLPLIQLMWENDKTAKERNIALRVFREVAIRFQGKAFKGLTKSLEDQFSTCMDENPEVNEILAKAIGIFVEFGGSVSESVIRGHPKALDKEYVMARDAAVASLGKIFEFNDLLIEKAYSHFLFLRSMAKEAFLFYHEGKELKESLKQDLTLWLSHLPMRSNRNEAKVVHHQLCLLFERSEKNLLGRNNDNLSEIFRVYAEAHPILHCKVAYILHLFDIFVHSTYHENSSFLQILLAGKKLATEQTMNQMITQLKRLRNKLLDDHWKSSMSSLEPHLQKKLESVLST